MAKEYRVLYYDGKTNLPFLSREFPTRDDAEDLRDRLNAEGAWRRACVVEFELDTNSSTYTKRTNP